MSGWTPAAPGTKGRDCGFVLICVLWVLAILTVVSIGLHQRALLDARAATYSMDYVKAMLMARGAVQRGIVELRNKEIIDWYNREEGGTGLGQAWAHPVDMLVEGIYYSLGDSEEFGEEISRYTIEDEERRISLNAANERLLENVEGLRGSQVRKIIRRRSHGTRREEEPQRFQTIEELRYMFRTIDDEDWFGDEERPGLKDVLTCWGSGLVNINTASPYVLQCIPDLRSGAVNAILNYRVGADGELGTEDDLAFGSLDEVAERANLIGKPIETLKRYCTTYSQFFTITGVATLRQGKVRACCKATVRGAHVLQWREEPIGS